MDYRIGKAGLLDRLRLWNGYLRDKVNKNLDIFLERLKEEGYGG